MTGQILPLLEQYLPKSRVAHSLRVAETARQLALLHPHNSAVSECLPEKAYLAGLLHDIAKAMSPQKLCDAGIAEHPWYAATYSRYPAVWHAFAGPRMIAHLLGPLETEISRAIRYHSTGTGKMSYLDSILYIADYIEPERPFADRAAIADLFQNEAHHGLLFGDKLALSVGIIATGSIIGLTKQQKAIHPLTLRCYNARLTDMTGDSRRYWQAHVACYY